MSLAVYSFKTVTATVKFFDDDVLRLVDVDVPSFVPDERVQQLADRIVRDPRRLAAYMRKRNQYPVAAEGFDFVQEALRATLQGVFNETSHNFLPKTLEISRESGEIERASVEIPRESVEIEFKSIENRRN